MNVSREQIMTALFGILSSASFAATSDGSISFATKSRRLKLWTDVPAQPAIYLVEHHESVAYQSEITPSKATLKVEVWVYAKTGDPTAPLSIDLNNILDGVDACLKPSAATGRQQLGGLVSHCRVEGTVFKDPGDLDGQAMAIIPISIFVP